MKIKDQIFIVTGGASGLGEQVVHSLIQQGALVSILDINATAGEALATKVNAFYPGRVDVTIENQVEEAIENTLQHYPNNKLAGAVLCSGIVMPPPSLKGYGPKGMLTSYSQFEHTLKVNLLGTYLVAQKVAERLIGNEPLDGERGVIITTSSITGLDGLITAYGTSKAGIAGLTLPLARELSCFGIRVMCIAPGTFDTPIMTTTPIEPPLGLFPKRLGKPQEFADMVLHIINMPYLNGSVMRLDAGLRATI